MYESYDLPAGHAAHAAAGGGELMPTLDELLFGHRALIVADFAQTYGIRLHRTSNADMTWGEFAELLKQLFATPNTRLFRRFAPKRDDRTQPDNEGGDDE